MDRPNLQSRKEFPVKTLHYGNEARNKEGLKGRLIIVEGIDGSGKSTQIHLLEQWLRSRNISCISYGVEFFRYGQTDYL